VRQPAARALPADAARAGLAGDRAAVDAAARPCPARARAARSDARRAGAAARRAAAGAWTAGAAGARARRGAARALGPEIDGDLGPAADRDRADDHACEDTIRRI